METQHIDPNDIENVYEAPSEQYYPLGTAERHRSDRLRQEIRRAILERRHNEALAEECTFAPQVLHPSFSLATAAVPTDCNPTGAPAAAAAVTAGSNVSRETAASSGYQTSRSLVFDRLSEQGEIQRRRHEERVVAKERMDAEQFRKAFKPLINTRASRDGLLSQGSDKVPVEERLLHYGEAKALSHDERRAQKELEEEAGWRQQKDKYLAEVKHFQAYKRRHEENKKAFEERNESLVRERARKQIEAELRFHEAMTFKPTICPTSAALDCARNDRAGFAAAFPTSAERGELLYYQNLAKAEQKATQAEQAPKEVREPVTNPTSDRLIQNSDHRYLFERDFVTRQEVYQQARAKMQVLEEQQRAEAERRARAEPPVQPVEKLVDRLYYKPKETREERQVQRREKRDTEESGACTFAPQLAPGTKHVLSRLQKREPNVVKRLAAAAESKSGSTDKENTSAVSAPATERERRPVADGGGCAVGDRLLADGANGLQARQTPKQTTRWVSSCALASPASPKAPSRSGHAADNEKNSRAASASPAAPKRVTKEEMDKFYERQMETITARDRFVDDARKVELLRESATCTFQPQTNTMSSTSPLREYTRSSTNDDSTSRLSSRADAHRGEPVVLGVNEYLKRQAAARQQKEEKEECLRNMGCCRSTVPVRGFTTIEAFHFKTEEMSARKGQRANMSM